MASASWVAPSLAVTRGYGCFGGPGRYQALIDDLVEHAGNGEIKYASGLAGDGETRTRTGGSEAAATIASGLRAGRRHPRGPQSTLSQS
jgi:hypothetical protein